MCIEGAGVLSGEKEVRDPLFLAQPLYATGQDFEREKPKGSNQGTINGQHKGGTR